MSEILRVRQHMIDSLRRELLGPDPGRPFVQWAGPGSELNGEEVLRPQDRPRMRYGAGILFPNGMTYSGLIDGSADSPDVYGDEDALIEDLPEQTDTGDEDDQGDDDEVPVLNSFVPSSMGISFLADCGEGLEVEVSWATYSERQMVGWAGARDGTEKLWFRTPHIQKLVFGVRDPSSTCQWTEDLQDGVGPRVVFVDRPWRDGLRLVTVTMLNTRQTVNSDDADCFFQCGLRVSPTGKSSIHPYPSRPDHDLDDEELSLKLLYRHRPVYAVGHGCAADWREDAAGGVLEVLTDCLPTYTQDPVLPRNALVGVDLSMLQLSRAHDEDILESCRQLVARYGEWIQSKRSELEDAGLSSELVRVASLHLDRCEESLGRMAAGIDVLGDDDDAMTAFRWMNLAMVQQRSHYALAAEKDKRRAWVKVTGGQAPERPFITPEYPESVAWRPFQLAFILMNLRSFADGSDEGLAERDLVDVIWFPTGGGKTEAYLGLASWVMFLRRLREPANAGVSVLMRYTLRLLTAQQFQRASSMICAMEIMRRERPARLGGTPFTIGLWLGSGVTPNKDEDAVTQLRELDNGDGPNTFVVLACPWCGVEMGRRDIGGRPRVMGYEKVRVPHASVALRCEDPNCAFHATGLPLEVVDERIYRNPPTMVIGTVDKFAMLAWTPEARKLFGIDVPGVGPPDLIIQDELHLISGPLGSMVGHYETLIDELCSRPSGKGRRGPKIVASTATIARADEQVRALYARPARLFPPQALRAGDSFFAEERPDIPGRTYVGVLASGLSSHVVAQIRTTAALLQAPASLRNEVEAASLDPYWSLVAYFNSLRELGRASTLIQADIREYLNWTWQRAGTSESRLDGVDLRRFINKDVELTSRVPSGDIPAVLERLFTGLPNADTVDVCFATNMIQVGLDVPRLSLMMIVGQPKGASEYIQASSRVGRDIAKPGLVVTNYNPFKPRDRSHFETFRQYHEAIYRFVEPTSVTPFSLPVADRAIHALAIALIRCRDPQMRAKPGNGPSEELQQMVREVVRRRIDQVAPDELGRAGAVLDAFFRDWLAKRPERYGDFSPVQPAERPLMIPAGRIWDDGSDPIPRSTPSSMRNVDGESAARVLSAFTAGES
jgi:hypothetical protein